MIHLSLLRNHARWAVFLRNLKLHRRRRMSLLPRHLRLERGDGAAPPGAAVRALHGAGADGDLRQRDDASPAATASELIGQTVAEVTDDGSPQGARTVALWEPALRTDLTGENGAPVRRSAGAEAARVMADLIAEGARTLTFVRSRRGAELTALGARARLEDVAPELAGRVASYRAGYLAEDRRALERALADGRAARAGHHQRAGTRRRHRGAGRRGAGRVSRHRHVVLAAGRTGGPTRAERADRADRPRRSTGHLPGAPSGRAAGQADRAGGHRPVATPTCSGRNCSARQRNCR